MPAQPSLQPNAADPAAGSKLRAVVFDCFGVLYDDAFKLFIQRYVTPTSPQPTEHYYDLALAADRGLVTDDAFYTELAELSGQDPDAILHELHDDSPLNHEVVTIIESVRSRYQIGLLSNAERSFLDQFINQHNLRRHFDAVLASSETPYVKPERGIFEIMADRLGVTFGEMIFIDDSSVNVAAAQSYGITSIIYETPAHLRRHLNEAIISFN